jgi:hypothetical protein
MRGVPACAKRSLNWNPLIRVFAYGMKTSTGSPSACSIEVRIASVWSPDSGGVIRTSAQMPAARISPLAAVMVEDVVRHLVVEHGVGPISDDWEQVLTDAEEAFREIQRKRVRA